MKLPELDDDVLGEQVRARRRDLPDLHEGRAEPLERVAQTDAERLAARVTRSQPRAYGREAPHAGDVEDVVESLVDKDTDDLPVPFEVLVGRHGR